MHTETLIVKNIFEKNGCLAFDKTRAVKLVKDVPALAALCVITSEPNLPRSLEVMDRACAEQLEPLLFQNQHLKSFRLWLFVAHGPWQRKSVMVKHKKLWRSLPWRLPEDISHLGEEIAVESDEGIRYASVAEVSRKGFYSAVHILRQEGSSTLLLSQREDLPSKNGISDLFRNAFCPKDEKVKVAVDWLNLSLFSSMRQDMVMRLGGSWDERETALSLILPAEMLSLFSLTSPQ
jgi:hypothetical protein